MATVDEIARAATATGGGGSDCLVLAHQWVNHRYQQAVGMVRFRHLRRIGTATLPKALVNQGTVTTTQGRTTVTGTGTTWDATLVGRWFKTGVAWYQIAAVVNPTQLELSQPMAEASVTDAGSWIVERYLHLPGNVRFAQSFVLARLWSPLAERSLIEFDDIAPGRPYTTQLGTAFVANAGVVADMGYNTERDTHDYEVWPYSLSDEIIHYVYWTEPPTFEADQQMPRTIDLFDMREGVLCDVYRWRAAQAATAGRFDVAGYFGNEAARQETRWKQVMGDMARKDRGADDLYFMWTRVGGRDYLGDIRNAHEDVFSRGRRFA